MPLPSKEVLDEITYKSIVIVFPIWTASIILGAAWANEAWGGYWSWDPKEVWALIVWLFFWSLSSCEADAWMERQKNRMDGGLWLYNCVDMLLCSKPLLPWAS